MTDTDPNNNEYVLFESNGIYMQVINDGCGDYIAKGKTQNVLCRFTEYCLANRAKICDDAITLTNDVPAWAAMTDEISVKIRQERLKAILSTSKKSLGKYLQFLLLWYRECHGSIRLVDSFHLDQGGASHYCRR